jgi:hypothetical protein
LDFVKMTGIVVLLSLLCTSLVLTNSVYEIDGLIMVFNATFNNISVIS